MVAHLLLLTVILALVMYMAIVSAHAKRQATGTAAQKKQLDEDLKRVEIVGAVMAVLGLLLMGALLTFERGKEGAAAPLGGLMTWLVIFIIIAALAGAYGAETVRSYMSCGHADAAKSTLHRLTLGSSVVAGILGVYWLVSLWRMYQARRPRSTLPFTSPNPQDSLGRMALRFRR